MQSSSRFHSISARLSAARLRTSFRRRRSSSSALSRSSTSSGSFSSSSSADMSPVGTINSIVLRQPSIVDLEEERRSFGSELSILEPRPVVYWGSVEERMGSL